MATMSSLKLKHLLLLLVLLVSCALCSSHIGTYDEVRAPSPPPTRPPGYDYFLLALTWPNGFCSTVGITCIPSPPEQQYFTIHGLWPQNNRGSAPINCQAPSVTDDILKALEAGLMDYWPSLFNAESFEDSKPIWRRQWKKHGSCSSNKFPPKEYFEGGIALGENYGEKILNYLKDGDIKPDSTTEYNSAKVLDAIEKGTKKKAIISCTKNKNNKLQLSEVRLCFNDDAQTLKDCTKGSPSCSENFIFANTATSS